MQIIEKEKYVHSSGMPFRKKVLIVVSSPATSTQTNWPIGYWASELTHPLLVFREAGFEVDLASTAGGEVIMDLYSDPYHESGYSDSDVITKGYLQQDWFKAWVKNTKGISDVNSDDYDAIFLAGGQGPMYTFRGNKELERLFNEFYSRSKPSAAICHATAMLLDLKTKNGELLVKRKTWTGFTNSEEDIVDQAVGMKVQPYRIEDEAGKIGETTFKTAHPFSSYVIADGNLITGQQQNSGIAAAEMVVEKLTKS